MKYIKLGYILSFCLVFNLQFASYDDLINENDIDTESKIDIEVEIAKISKLIVPETRKLYLNLNTEIEKLKDDFIDRINDKIDTLKSYSSKNSQTFIKFINDEVQGFRFQLKVLSEQTIADYYKFLEKHESNFEYKESLTASQIVFVDGIDQIVQEALVIIQKIAVDITSENIEKEVSVRVQHGFFESELDAQKSYEKQLDLNEKAADKSWWDNLKGFGSSYLNALKPIAQTEIGKEVAKQTQNFINDVGSEIASEVGAKLKSFSKSTTLSGISEKLDKMSKDLTDSNPDLKKKIALLTDTLKGKGLDFWESKNAYNDVAVAAFRRAVRLKYRNDVPTAVGVTVRSGQGLCSQEQAYLKNRTKVVQEVLKKEFGIQAPLRIAFCCSGGGNRAMIGTLGMFMSAAKHNVLQSSTYVIGLSGSTWTIAPWVYLYSKGLLKTNSYQSSLMDLKNNFISTLDDSSMLDPLKNNVYTVAPLKGDVKTIFSNQIIQRFGFDQPVSLVNGWGALIGNYALNIAKNSKLSLTWSEITSLVMNGALPLPLCSSAFDPGVDDAKASKQEVGAEYEWFESGPFEAGSKVLGYVPIQYLGSIFNQGNIVSELACPEYPMSFYLGVYGSAFSLALNDLIEKGLKNPSIDVLGQQVQIPVAEWMKQMIQEGSKKDIKNKREDKIHAKFANFSKGLSNSYLKDKDDFALFDGGVAFNIPLPLALDHAEREVDIVIIYDSNPGDLQALQSADKYFKRKNISVPKMGDLKKSDLVKGTYPMTVFNDPRSKSYNKSQPTLIYFPTNVDVKKAPFTTGNFRYTKDNINALMSKVSDLFDNHADDVKVIMQKVAQIRKNSVITPVIKQDKNREIASDMGKKTGENSGSKPVKTPNKNENTEKSNQDKKDTTLAEEKSKGKKQNIAETQSKPKIKNDTVGLVESKPLKKIDHINNIDFSSILRVNKY